MPCKTTWKFPKNQEQIGQVPSKKPENVLKFWKKYVQFLQNGNSQNGLYIGSVNRINSKDPNVINKKVRRPGIEPGPPAWKAGILTTELSTQQLF